MRLLPKDEEIGWTPYVWLIYLAYIPVQGVLDQVIHAVELLFAFALVAGLVVLVATVSATREARAREFAVMRAVGASGALLGRVQRVELLGVGALAGLLAASAAVAVGWGLAKCSKKPRCTNHL